MRFLGNRPRAFPYESTFTCSRFHNESGSVPYAAMRWRICDATSLPYMRVPIPFPRLHERLSRSGAPLSFFKSPSFAASNPCLPPRGVRKAVFPRTQTD